MEFWNFPSPCVATGKAVEASPSIPTSPLHVFCHPSPKKETKPGMDGTLMSFSLQSIPPGLLSQFPSCPAPGVPSRGSLSGDACSVPFREIHPKFGSLSPNPTGAAGAVSEVSPPPTATQVSPPSLPGREQQWEAIPVIFKILCTFWGGSWGSLPPFPRNF